MIQQGDPAMLALWGAGDGFEGRCARQPGARRVVVGNRPPFTVTLCSTSAAPSAC